METAIASLSKPYLKFRSKPVRDRCRILPINAKFDIFSSISRRRNRSGQHPGSFHKLFCLIEEDEKTYFEGQSWSPCGS